MGCLESREALWRDLDRVESWAITNPMKFNNTVCWILPLGWDSSVVCTNWGT